MAVIALDAKRAFCNSSGLGVYSRTLITSLAGNFPQHEYHLFTPRDKGKFPGAESLDVQLHVAPKAIPGSLWRSVLCTSEVSRINAGIYHGLSNELPAGRMPGTAKIITIHDLIFLTHPELYPAVDRFFYKRKFLSGIRNADAIVAISNTTKKAIQEIGGINPDKITVVYQGCDAGFFNPVPKNKLPWTPENYLLFVGNVEERKDLLTLLRALVQVPDANLVIAGAHTDHVKKLNAFIRENQLEKRVILSGRVSKDDLHALYQHATAIVYPSYAEGWGLPVAEGICYGKPVITTSGTSMEEIAAGAGLFFQPGNDYELSQQINKLLQSEVLQGELSGKAKQKAGEFHPDLPSKKYMTLYEKFL